MKRWPTYLRKDRIAPQERERGVSRPKSVSEKQVCENHESQRALHSSVQESERCESVCKFGASDVPKAMAVRRGGIYGRDARTVQLLAAGPPT